MDYINRGPDPRAGGWLGAVFAFVQTKLSFHTDWRAAHVLVAFPPYVSLALPIPFTFPHRYATVRIGWRFDGNWRGYIFDVVIKLWETQVHY